MHSYLSLLEIPMKLYFKNVLPFFIRLCTHKGHKKYKAIKNLENYKAKEEVAMAFSGLKTSGTHTLLEKSKEANCFYKMQKIQLLVIMKRNGSSVRTRYASSSSSPPVQSNDCPDLSPKASGRFIFSLWNTMHN